MSPEDEARLRELAWREAYRRHQKASDADGFGCAIGHAGRFHECAHEECVLVRAAPPAAQVAIGCTVDEREWLVHAARLSHEPVELYVKVAINARLSKQGVDAVLFNEDEQGAAPPAAEPAKEPHD